MEIQLSTPLGLASLANTRDLGGMIGADGRRILPGKLFRSGLLARIFASKGEKQDQEAVSYMFCAKTEFLEVVAQCIEESYGGYEAFFQEGLKLSAEDLARLRTLYLE